MPGQSITEARLAADARYIVNTLYPGRDREVQALQLSLRGWNRRAAWSAVQDVHAAAAPSPR